VLSVALALQDAFAPIVRVNAIEYPNALFRGIVIEVAHNQLVTICLVSVYAVKKLSFIVPRTSLTSASVASHSAEIELIELTRCARKALATYGNRMCIHHKNERTIKQGQLVSELSEQSQLCAA
jgi:hypothetical protein